MVNIIDDLSILTDVPEKTLSKFIPIINYCISHAIYEAIVSKQDTCEIDLGFGELCVKFDAKGILYKFIPCDDLEKSIVTSIKSKVSPMMCKLENNLQEKIDRAYKELL